MFGDFFQRVGNLFTGSGWVNDDEERRKKRQPQQPAPRPQVKPRPEFQSPFEQPKEKKPTFGLPQAKPNKIQSLTDFMQPKPEPVAKPKPKLSSQEQKWVTDYNSASNRKAFDKSRAIFKRVLAGEAGAEEQARAKKLAPLIEMDWTKQNLKNTTKKTGEFIGGIAHAPVDIVQAVPASLIRTYNEATGKKNVKMDAVGKFLTGRDEIGDFSGYGKEVSTGVGGVFSQDWSKNPDWVNKLIGAGMSILDVTPAGTAAVATKTGIKTGVEQGTKEGIRTGLRRIADKNSINISERTGIDKEELSAAMNKAIDGKQLTDKELAILKQADDSIQVNAPKQQPTTATKEEVALSYKTLVDQINNDTRLTPQQKVDYLAEAKTRHADMLKQLDDSAQKSAETVTKQGEDIAAAEQQRAAVVAKAQEEQQAVNAPKDVVETQPTSVNTEDVANNGYANDWIDETLKLSGIENAKDGTKESAVSKFIHKAAAGDIRDAYRGAVDKARDAVADTMMKATSSGNTINSAIPRAATLIFQNAAVKDATRLIIRRRNDAQAAATDATKRLARSIAEKVKATGDPKLLDQKLDQIFETPEFLARRYGQGTQKLTPAQLTPEERAVYDDLIRINQIRNDALFRQGKISAEEHAAYADGTHSPRLYDFEKEGFGVNGSKLIDTTSTIARKELDKIDDATFERLIDSPVQRMLIRYEKALRSQATDDALFQMDRAGLLLPAAPNNQFSTLSGAKWGKYQGKVVYNPLMGQLSDQIVMNTKGGRAMNDLLDTYRDSVLGKADRFVKKTKTVYSPGTFLGNVLSNPLLFNRAAGVNPVLQSARMAKASKDLAQHASGSKFDPTIREAQRYGIFSGDSGKGIVGERRDQGDFLQPGKWYTAPERIYGGVDDAAKLAAYRGLRARGVTPEDAARRVMAATQDYNNVGRMVQTLADSPVIGKPFARFAPELVRLVKNNVLYNPGGMFAGVALVALIQNELQSQSGENDQERDAREDTVGQTKIPGTAWIDKLIGGKGRDISLNFPIGDSAYNIARATGLNFPQEPNSDPNTALINAITPWANPTRTNAQGDLVFAPEEVFSSMTLQPLARQIMNRDFMGREITDPENKTYFERPNGQNVQKYSDDLSSEAQTGNRIASLLMSYVPLANEANAITSATAGQKDFYGKERTIPQAIQRMFGVKVESNTPEVREERLDAQRYFEEDLPAIQGFLRENPDLADSYFKYRNPSRNRITNEKTSDLVSPERWSVIAGDRSGRLFNFIKEQAVARSEREETPLDPLYQLPDDQANQIIQLKSMHTGDDIKAQEDLYNYPWFQQYKAADKAYQIAKPEFQKFPGQADENARVVEWTNLSEQAFDPVNGIAKNFPLVAQQKAINAKYGFGSPESDAFYQNNKAAYNAQNKAFKVAQLDIINKMRAIEGVPPLTEEAFLESSSGGFGKGYGGGGADTYGILGTLFNAGEISKLPLPTATKKEINLAVKQFLAGGGGSRAKARLGASASGNPRRT